MSRLFAGVILIILVTGFSVKHFLEKFQPREVRVGLNFVPTQTDFDPRSLETSVQFDLASNLFSRLMRTDVSGQLTTDLPSSLKIDGRTVVFEFKRVFKTSKHNPIGAEDAAASLKRLILDGQTAHESLKRFLCRDERITQMGDSCSGIQVRDSTLLLEVDAPEHVSILLRLFDNPDYSVVPKSDFDSVDGKWRAVEDLEFSGPYNLNRNDLKTWTLIANETHWKYSPEMPQRVVLFPMKAKESLPAFLEDRIDVLPITTYFGGPLAKTILSDAKFSLYESIPTHLDTVGFSDRAKNEFSPQQRLYVGLRIAQALGSEGLFHANQTIEFFQPANAGALSDSQLATIKDLRSRVLEKAPAFAHPMTFGVAKSSFAMFAKALANEPGIRVIDTGSDPMSLPARERPDAYFITCDTSWGEDITSVAYNLENGYLTPSSGNGKQWMDRFLDRSRQEERVRDLNELQFHSLKEATIFPFSISPYYAVARNGWVFKQSKLVPGDDFWAMRRE